MIDFLQYLVCDIELDYLLPYECPNCGKRNLNHDLYLVPSMHHLEPIHRRNLLKMDKKLKIVFQS